MFHWLSSYNYDFALAAIPIQLILLAFYCSRRNLPVRSSHSFLWVMLFNLTMTASDLISCEMNEIWTQYPLWLMYVVNQAYFLSFIGRGWALFDYTAEECCSYDAMGRSSRLLSWIPAIGVSLLILSTPWTAAIFHFAPDRGYYNCEFYRSIYFSTYFYIAVSLLSVVVRWRRIPLRLKASVLGYNGVLIAGILLRKLFINTLVTSYFSILAILVIYLSAQNPDLYRDKRTLLFNQDAFDKIGAEFLRRGHTFHCILATVLNYESAKALYGHRQLDRSLQKLGRWMVTRFPGYYVFYFGNGNYLMLRQVSFQEHQEEILQNMREHFEQSWTSEDTDVVLSMAVMVLPCQVLPREVARAHDLIGYAFSQAYVENKRGNMVITEEMEAQIQRQEAVEAALGRALDERRVEAYFQPIYSTAEERIVGAEALARLWDPKLGFISPVEFIRVAERTGDIMELGRQIFEKVCIFLEQEHPEELGIQCINVNLSPAQCLNDQLSSELSAIAHAHNVPMSMIDFEITETSIEDFLLIQKQMLRLQKRGAEFSLDDFGTGTSNLTRLMSLPIHVVKLDMNVVNAYFNGESGILPDLVRMFQNANMKIVVEGVETEQMKAELADMGCDYEQGYYFSRPVPPTEFLNYLHAQRQMA